MKRHERISRAKLAFRDRRRQALDRATKGIQTNPVQAKSILRSVFFIGG
jgi:hypothetical protein